MARRQGRPKPNDGDDCRKPGRVVRLPPPFALRVKPGFSGPHKLFFAAPLNPERDGSSVNLPGETRP
jgi:hypothetical protein